MTTISTIELSNVVGAQQLARRTPALDAPADFLPPGLQPNQLTMDQFKADLHARVNIAFEIRRVRPWLTPAQAKDPKLVEEFMRPGF
jgi:hypothetical protein